METKSNERGSHGNGRSDDSVFEGESPAKTAGERDAAGEGDSERGREEEEEVGGCGGGECEGDCVREEKSQGVSVKCSTGEDTAPPTYPSPSRVLREEDEEEKETHSVGTTEDTLNSHQNNTPSSSSSATSLNHQTTGADSISTVTTTAVPNSVKTPPNASVTTAPPHKNRQSFSRRFATPIVVTHARRSFPKSLPKNLDPKSTVTLLLCSSPSSSSSDKTQQKHGKHGGNKHHKSNFSSRPKFKPSHHSSPGEGGVQEEAGPGLRDSAPSLVVQRLKGREKEREMWKKRFGNSPVTNGSSGDVGCEVVEVCRDESGEEGGGVRAKKSPEEMSAIQSRVRESLQAQGVVSH